MSLTLFAALAVPDGAAERMLALDAGRVPGANPRPRQNLHLTLRYFGDVQEPRIEALDEALSEIALRRSGFDVELNGPGAFGGADPHALILTVANNPSLMALAADCERAARRAGMKPEGRKYTPHVTLAYLAGASVSDVMAFQRKHALMKPIRFRADAFGLYSSWTKKSAPNLYRLEALYELGR